MSTQANATIRKENYRMVIETDDHHFVTDEPIGIGGKDLGPNPGELLSAALAACAAATMKMYADRKGWKLDEASVEVDFENNRKENHTVFTKTVQLTGDLDEEQQARLHEIAGKCPIHRILTGSIEIKEELT